MNETKQINTVEKLLQSDRKLGLGKRCYFPQANYTSHKTEATQERLQNNNVDVLK